MSEKVAFALGHQLPTSDEAVYTINDVCRKPKSAKMQVCLICFLLTIVIQFEKKVEIMLLYLVLVLHCCRDKSFRCIYMYKK